MSTKIKKITIDEIQSAFGADSEPVIPRILTTREAAELLRIQPKTLNDWKNAGLLEGTYRQRSGQDRYWRDRLVTAFFNGKDWNGKQTRKNISRRKSNSI